MGAAVEENQASGPSASHFQYTPTGRELDDVELLRMGLFGSPSRFEGADGPMRLCLPPEVAKKAQEVGGLEITDAEGVPLALVAVEGTAPTCVGHVGVIGTVRPLRGNSRRAFSRMYVAPSATRTVLPPETVTVPVDAPLTESDIAAIKELHAPVLFLVLTGVGTPKGLSAAGLIRATLTVAAELDDASVFAIPLASRPTVRRDEEFRAEVVKAYAPGQVWTPPGTGALSSAVADVVEHDRPSGLDRGAVVFFTGLSGSGKSTVAQALCNHLIETGGRSVTLLDGDRVRRNLSSGLTFSKEDRETNIERISWVAAEVARHGGLAVCCPIAPFDRTRKLARQMAEEGGAAFVLVYVSTPIDVCADRDRKGLYARAKAGEIADFTGISSPYEAPEDADLCLDSANEPPAESLRKLLEFLADQGILPRETWPEPERRGKDRNPDLSNA